MIALAFDIAEVVVRVSLAVMFGLLAFYFIDAVIGDWRRDTSRMAPWVEPGRKRRRRSMR